ncbi:hypothetical protein [Fodinibius salsisoli]|uniref:TQXA domain-containing protein n=1 Tax=Fodinibius salsisoli TaxID=2820877 RepID=A0ABT3PLX7_9BACT|nr:hypothetical protein [Fodinibius salsisoli]MCW9706768.1 hypothetical protein [Fodinibius salsisoli]
MKGISSHTIYILVAILLFNFSCTEDPVSNTSDLEDSLDPVEKVVAIEGGESATITVEKDSKAFFTIKFSEIKPNNIIQNGIKEGWCIDWQKPINSNNGTYNEIKLYSTYLVEKWMPVNYLLNIQENLQANDPEITYREIQLAIWSLRANPEFNLDEVDLNDLPNRFMKDGQAAFNAKKVNEVLNMVETGYRDYDFSPSGTKFAVIAETPVDVQTVFGVVEVEDGN